MSTSILRAGLLLFLTAPLGATFASATDKDKNSAQREVVVGCTSTVASDPGGCQRSARKKCKGDAEFVATLSSTPLATSGLHAISARYRCRKSGD